MSYDLMTHIWFLLLGVLLIGYAILDGFDLGVGILHPFVPRSDEERRLSINSIGPLWDGNEVWLVTFGGAMFAMFPIVYKSVFSGFYTAFILLLFALIFRAVSIEFRSKMHSHFWRRTWDYGFFLGSALAALLFGVAVGNVMLGVPLDAYHEFKAGLVGQLRPFPLLVGVLTVSLLAMHGSIFLFLKTTGALQQRLKPWMWGTFAVFAALFVAATTWALVGLPQATRGFREAPWLIIVPILNVLAVANIPRAIHKGKPGFAFFSSSCVIAALVVLFGAALYPNLVPASNNPAYSITIYNGRSSPLTLTIGLIIVAIGMPFVLAYTAVIYWTFRGKVELTEHSY